MTGVIYLDDNVHILDRTYLNSAGHETNRIGPQPCSRETFEYLEVLKLVWRQAIDPAIVTDQINLSCFVLAKGGDGEIHVKQ